MRGRRLKNSKTQASTGIVQIIDCTSDQAHDFLSFSQPKTSQWGMKNQLLYYWNGLASISDLKSVLLS